jgi:large subunit ribosomal protein L15
MKLNTITFAPGSRKTRLRVGRGASAGQGKTCGRGVKGQRARKGGYHKVGFEGGQMPLQRRLPKSGFRSKMSPLVAQVRLSELAKLQGNEVTLDALKAANLIPLHVLRARVMSSGKVEKAYTVRGIHLTKGARTAIEAAGGKLVEEAAA